MSDRKKSESLSLVEKLLRAYEQSHSAAEFSETKTQLKGLEWVERIMFQLEQNEQGAKTNDR